MTQVERENLAESELPSRTSWPVLWVIVAIVFGWLTCAFGTVALDGQVMNAARSLTQTCIAALLLLRVGIAVSRKEKNGAWRYYVAGSIFAVPLWIFAETAVRSLQ